MENYYKDDLKKITKIQAMIRGINYRNKSLPNSVQTIKHILQKSTINLCKTSNDGRVNSCIDENKIIEILLEELPNRIKEQQSRMWFDMCIYDYQYGWLPVNIKTTTTLTSDNTGNLAMCAYAYTDMQLDLDKTYNNGQIHTELVNKLKNEEYNYNSKKDYYFVIVNKNNTKDIIVNSVKGLTKLNPNINNLPFQICWDKNRIFNYKPIIKNIEMLLYALQKPKKSWREDFLNNIREITL